MGVHDGPEYAAEYKKWLDSSVDLESLSFRELAMTSEYWVGILLFEELDYETQNELRLRLVEGEYPGSTFCGVRFDGLTDELNAELFRRGINIRLLS